MRKLFFLSFLLLSSLILTSFSLNSKGSNPKSQISILNYYLSGVDDLDNLKVQSQYVGIVQKGYSKSFSVKSNYIYFGRNKANFDGDFVILKNGKLLLGRGHYHLSNSASQVKGAGQIGIDNGKITYIDDYSGHYRPNANQLASIVGAFKENNLASRSLKGYIYPKKNY